MDQAKIEKCFTTLESLLSLTLLPTEAGPGRKAVADEFMLMSEKESVLKFKHRTTRNYVWVVQEVAEKSLEDQGCLQTIACDGTWCLVIPNGGVFHKGVFDEAA